VSALRLVGTALRRALRWRLLLLVAFASGLPALLGAAPVALFLDSALARAPGGGGLASGLDGALLPDLARRLAERGTAGALVYALLGAAAVALVVSPWLAGAAMAEVTSAERLEGRRLLTAAGALWGRLVRLGLVSLLPLGVAAGLAALLRHRAGQAVERALTETAAVATQRRVRVATLVILFVALLSLDAARAVLAARPRRRSAFLAWTSGTWLMLRRPHAVIPAGLLGSGLALGLAFAFTALRTRLPAGPVPAMLASALLATLAAVSLGLGRSVRLGLLAAVAGADAGAREARVAARLAVEQAVAAAQRAAAVETSRRAEAEASLRAAQAAATEPRAGER